MLHIGKKCFSKQVGKISFLVYLFGLLTYQGFYILTEQFVAFFSIVVLFLLFKIELTGLSKKKGFLLQFSIGISIGLSILFKQTGGAIIIGLGLFYIFNKNIATATRKLSIVALGTIIPISTTSIYYYLNGGLRELVHWVVTIHLPGGSYSSLGPLGIFFGMLSNLNRFPLFGVLILLALFSYKELQQSYDVKYSILIWLGIASSLPLVIRTYPHYWIQVLPFGGLIGSVAFIHYKDRALQSLNIDDIKPVILSVFLILLIPSGMLIAQGGHGVLTESNINDDYQMGSYIQEETNESEEILAVTAEPKIYYLSNREPISENIYYLPANRGNHDEESIITNVENKQPRVIVIRSPCREYIESACDYIQSNYTVTQSFDSYQIYELNASG